MAMNIVIITGMSGSGKSVALHALEDIGYYCVDNLPPELLQDFVALEHKQQASHVAIATDARSGASLQLVTEQLQALRAQGHSVRAIFLDASTTTLVRRYSETRRKHPLAQTRSSESSLDGEELRRDLVQSIELERELLHNIRAESHIVDTSAIRSVRLQAYIKELTRTSNTQMTLVFESFAFKRGVPVDADYVFDVRMLPNPHYEPALRELTGRDAPVADFLSVQTEVQAMQQGITQFLEQWLEPMARDQRSYVTVAIGCTGGQHRSVFLVEQLTRIFSARKDAPWVTLKRHRELDV
ncbi:MAG: RNase adapter RapZ [Betaproteobacteria bacterium]|nr:RNase adapter RapZ [Betaproteobacteria bacterium]